MRLQGFLTYILLLLVAICTNNTSLFSQDFSGREFWLTVPRVGPTAPTDGARIVIISDYCIEDGKLEFPALDYEQAFTVTKGEYTEIRLPTTVSGKPYFHSIKDRVEAAGIKLTAEFPFAAYVVTYKSASVDGESILPAQALGTDYVIQQRGVMVQGDNRATVVATQNNTEINIQTWNWISRAPEDLTITLDEGETYQFTSRLENCNADYAREPYEACSALNGATVIADKPISIITSVDCSGGNECGACENMMSMQRPSNSWGTEYIATQIMPRGSSLGSSGCYIANADIPSGDFVDILGEVGTTVTVTSKSGTNNYTIPDLPYANGRSTGYGYLFIEEDVDGADYGFANMHIKADRPIQVSQYAKGWQTDGMGSSDPETLQLFDRNSWQKSYLFAVLTTGTTLNNDFVVVVEDVGAPLPSTTIEYDGANINGMAGATGWQPIPNTNFKYNRVPVLLSTNTHRIESTSNAQFGLFSIGRGQAESYILSGGIGGIIDNPLCPTCPIADFDFSGNVCIGNTVAFTDLSSDNDPSGATQIVDWTWDFGDGTVQSFTSSTNPTHRYLNPGTYTITLTITNDDQSEGGPCTISIQKLIVIYDGPTAFAGPDKSICVGESVQLGGFPSATGDATPFTYSWKPTTGLDNSNIDHPNASPTSGIDYEFNVIDTNGCIGIDFVRVDVYPKDSVYLTEPGKICPGESHTFTVNIVGNSSPSYDLSLSDGVNITNHTVINGASITVTPSANSNYTISAFSGDDPNACYVFDTTPLEVQVRNAPVLNTPNDQTICEGNSTTVDLVFDSSGPFEFDLTESTGTSTTLSNIVGPNYQLSLTPSLTTTYTISNLSYADDPKCSGVGADISFTINVEGRKTTGDPNTASICNTASALNLNDLRSGTFSDNGTWVDQSGSGAISGNSFNPANLNPNDYIVRYQFDATAVCPEVFTDFTITVNEAPQLISISENCDEATLADYKVEALIEGGDPGTYNSPDGTFAAASGNMYRFTSNADYATKTNYTITIDDANMCGPLVINGYKNCGCKTNAGTVDATDIDVCESDIAHIKFNKDSVLLPGDGFYFVLHNGDPSTIGTILETSTDTVFAYTANLSKDTKYYVTPIAGKLKADGTIDMLDDCYVKGNSVALTFHSLFTYTLVSDSVDICSNGAATIDINISGGTPNFEIDITNQTTSTSSTEIFTTSPISINADNSTYTFVIDEVRDQYCSIFPNDVGNVYQRQTPSIASENYVCNGSATQYQHAVVLANNDANSTQLTPTTNGSFDAATNTFTSVWINSGGTQTTDFTDQYNCGTLTVTSNHTCACISAAGSFNVSGTQYACEGQNISIPFNNDEVIDANDIHYFILCSNASDPFGSEIQRNTTPDFNFTAGMTAGTRYYILSAVGSDTDGDGNIDANDPCRSFSTLIPVEFRPLPTITLSGAQNICAGQTATITTNATGTGPFTFDYSDGSSTTTVTLNNNADNFTVTVPSTTTYSAVSITDTYGCTNSISGQQVTITTTSAPTASISSTSDICAGDQTTLSISLTGTPPYDFTITGDQGYSQTISAHTNSTYTTTLSPAITETYTVSSISDALCSGTPSGPSTTTVHALPSGSINGPASICHGDNLDLTINLTGTGPFDVVLIEDGNDVILNNISTGYIYNAAYRDGNNPYLFKTIVDNSPAACTGSGTGINVQVNTLPEGQISGSFTACEGDIIDLPVNIQGNAPFVVDLATNTLSKTYNSVSDGSSTLAFELDFGDGSFNITMPLITDVNGCTNTGTGASTIVAHKLPDIQPRAINAVGCKPLDVKLYHKNSNSNERFCIWDLGNNVRINSCDTVYTSYDESGNYNVNLTIESVEGCINSANLNGGITVHYDPVANFNSNPTKPTVNDNVVHFTSTSTGAVDFDWHFGDFDSSTVMNPTIVFRDDTVAQYPVELIAYNSFGCPDTILKYIKIDGEILVYIPNAFTPDGDGNNEGFKPVLSGVKEDLELYEFYIFNRWGELIFETNDTNVSWDGKYQGEFVKNGVYVYRVIVKSVYDAEKQSFHGGVNMIR